MLFPFQGHHVGQFRISGKMWLPDGTDVFSIHDSAINCETNTAIAHRHSAQNSQPEASLQFQQEFFAKSFDYHQNAAILFHHPFPQALENPHEIVGRGKDHPLTKPGSPGLPQK